MHTPVDFAKEIGQETDSNQASALSRLRTVYGAFISLLVLIPNPMIGRACILFCPVLPLCGTVWLLHAQTKASGGHRRQDLRRSQWER